MGCHDVYNCMQSLPGGGGRLRCDGVAAGIESAASCLDPFHAHEGGSSLGSYHSGSHGESKLVLSSHFSSSSLLDE
jgi:hypothetical protein